MNTDAPQPADSLPAPEPITPAPLPAEPPDKLFIPPSKGELIKSGLTGCTYTIGDVIGEGSFGVVYECSDDWNNELAAKVLKPTRSYDEVRVAAEAEIAKLFQLRHPHITHFYDAFEYRDTFYIITERCNFSLAQFFAMEWFHGPTWTLPIARSLLQAVQFLHLNGFAHQDIHSGNVFALFAPNELTPNENQSTQFRLGDLGVAKLFSDIRPENTRAPWMLPPEVLNSSEFGAPDHRVDIYHCGLLFLQLEHSQELRFTKEEILGGKPRQMALELAPPRSFALEKALRRHVSLRTETARELWRDLNTPGAPAAKSNLELPFSELPLSLDEAPKKAQEQS